MNDDDSTNGKSVTSANKSIESIKKYIYKQKYYDVLRIRVKIEIKNEVLSMKTYRSDEIE